MAELDPHESDGEFASAESDSESPEKAETVEKEKGPSDPAATSTVKDNTPIAVVTGNESTEETGPLDINQDQRTNDNNLSNESVVEGSAGENETQPKGSGWGWGWSDLSSVWSSSVSAVTGSAQAISKGLGSVVAGVEETLGVPAPQEMARGDETISEEKDTESHEGETKSETSDVIDQPVTGFGGFLTGFASAVQSTGMNIVSGGLDALEVIGRKTVDIISEGDPGLRKKRALLSGDHSTLSQLLKEAKERFTNVPDTEDHTASATFKLNYSVLFDEYGGLAHLEALELLSKECSNKLETNLSAFTGQELADIKEAIESLCQYFTIEDDEENDEEEGNLNEIEELLKGFGEKLKVGKVIQASQEGRSAISLKFNKTQSESTSDENLKEDITGEVDPSPTNKIQDFHEIGLRSLVKLCSQSMQLLHKTAEIMLLLESNEATCKENSEKLHKVSLLISLEFDSIASMYAEKLTEECADEADPTITNLYLEASNSSSYIQSAFKLLLPVVQLKLLQAISKSSI